MNERIRKLSRQAIIAIRAKQTHLPPLEESVISRILELREELDEKFAELIVQECTENFTKVWYEQGLDVRGAEISKFLTRFNEHFGIK